MSTVPVCRELIILTHAEIARLEALPDAANMVEEDLRCELQAGHEGPHLALGQAYGHNDNHDGHRTWLCEQMPCRGLDRTAL